MVWGLLPANSCEEFMYPAYCYYLASVGRPDVVGIRSYRYSACESSEQKSKYDQLETKSLRRGRRFRGRTYFLIPSFSISWR